jgi:hypothetical protein
MSDSVKFIILDGSFINEDDLESFIPESKEFKNLDYNILKQYL